MCLHPCFKLIVFIHLGSYNCANRPHSTDCIRVCTNRTVVIPSQRNKS